MKYVRRLLTVGYITITLVALIIFAAQELGHRADVVSGLWSEAGHTLGAISLAYPSAGFCFNKASIWASNWGKSIGFA